MGIRVWRDPHFSWRREWLLELGIFCCVEFLHGCHDVMQKPSWDGTSWVGMGPHGTRRGPGSAPILHPLGCAGLRSLDC